MLHFGDLTRVRSIEEHNGGEHFGKSNYAFQPSLIFRAKILLSGGFSL